MKLNIILFFTILIAASFACNNTKKTNAEDASQAATPEKKSETDTYPWKASGVAGSNPDSARNMELRVPPKLVNVPMYLLPDPSASRRAYLSGGYWWLSMAYQPSNSQVHKEYQSKYLKFREDKTFDIVINHKVKDTGHWNWDDTKNEIYLQCNDPYINNTWGIQDKGYTMIWKGNTDVNVTGIQIRVVNLTSMPAGN